MARFLGLGELFEGRHFDREVIILCVRWYLRFKLSFRDLTLHRRHNKVRQIICGQPSLQIRQQQKRLVPIEWHKVRYATSLAINHPVGYPPIRQAASAFQFRRRKALCKTIVCWGKHPARLRLTVLTAHMLREVYSL
jgi:hypothetical protein